MHSIQHPACVRALSKCGSHPHHQRRCLCCCCNSTLKFLQAANCFSMNHVLYRIPQPWLYRAFHNVLHDYKHLQQENQSTLLNGIVHSHRKTEKDFFFYNYRCLMCAPRVIRHTLIRYSSSCHTRINMCTVSPVVHTSNISNCQKKTFSVFLWLWTIPLREVLWFSCHKCL